MICIKNLLQLHSLNDNKLLSALSETIDGTATTFTFNAVDTGTGWTWPVQDALGSVRGYVGDHNRVLSNVNYSEYGIPSTPITGFAFTGEWRDQVGVQYHRAR
jgi:hypothetical protein